MKYILFIIGLITLLFLNACTDGTNDNLELSILDDKIIYAQDNRVLIRENPSEEENKNFSYENNNSNLKNIFLVEMKVALSGLYNIYSPSIISFKEKKIMLMGGWLNENDYATNDKIYYSEYDGGSWKKPIVSFEKKGYLINDPSVIQPPSSDGVNRSEWLYMYYTANSDKNENPTNGNIIGMASSVDGGKTWTDRGIIIDLNNGYNDCGAWSPSAIVKDDEIWIYYHGNEGCFVSKFLTKLKLNGVEKIETQILSIHDLAVNVNVVYRNGIYYMTANSPDEKSIFLYYSYDGINWDSKSFETLIVAGENFIVTPELDFINDTQFDLYFGYSTIDNMNHDSIHAWRFQINETKIRNIFS